MLHRYVRCTEFHVSVKSSRVLALGSIYPQLPWNHSDAVGASPVGAAPATSSRSTLHLAWTDCVKTTARRDNRYLSCSIWCDLYYIFAVYFDLARHVDHAMVCNYLFPAQAKCPVSYNPLHSVCIQLPRWKHPMLFIVTQLWQSLIRI